MNTYKRAQFITLMMVLVLFKFTPSFSQSSRDTIWYDSQWKDANRDNATYYRAGIVQENGIFKVSDRYLNGDVQMAGTYSSLSPDVRSGFFKYYDTKKRLCAEEMWVNDQMSGTCTYYDTLSGNVSSKRLYEAGKLNGMSTYYNRNTGKLVAEEMFVDGKREGLSVYYDSVSGQMTKKENFHLDKLDGTVISYYPSNGQIRTSTMYVNDTIRGGMQAYDTAGTLRAQIKPDDHDLYEQSLYDSVGRKVASGKMRKGGIREGLWQIFDPITGNVSTEAYIANDLPQGRFTNYDPTCHNVLSIGNMVKGLKDGEWKYYKPCDTNFSKLVGFEQGVLNGRYILYDSKTNRPTRIGQHRWGSETGKWTYYFPGTNNVHMVRTYLRGELDSKLTTYYPDGSLRREEDYNQGACVTRHCYTQKGKDTTYYSRTKLASYRTDYQNFFNSKMIMPQKALENGIEGKVMVKIFISDAGLATAVTVVSTTNILFNREAMRLALLLPIYHAQTEDDVPIETSITIPVVFSQKNN